ncbi:MAG: flagellar hook-associated protein FlgL [Fimbriimonadaceae bacterium]
MRISTAYQYDSYSRDVNRAQQSYVSAQRLAANGIRVSRPSDDPSAMSAIVSMKSLRRGIDQYEKNLNTAKAVLGFTEGILSESHQIMRRGYELALRGANSPSDQAGREAMAKEIGEMQRRLVALANSTGPSNEFVFGGQAVKTTPFTLSGTTLQYNGDNGQRVAETGPGQMIVVSIAGESLFREAYDRLETLRNHLMSGNTGALSGESVSQMQQSMNAFNDARGTVGARLQSIEEARNHHIRRSDELMARISDEQEVDMAEAIVRLKTAETAYTAALTVASQGYRLSLMDFIRG